MRKFSSLFLALPFLFWFGPTRDLTPDQEIFRPYDLELEGLMNRKIGITFRLEKLNAENVAFSGDCFDIFGNYMYKNYLLPIEIEGRVCPTNNTFEIWHDKGGMNEEHFIGGLGGFLKTWDGKWTQTETGKSMPFNLIHTEFLIGEKTKAPFMELINDDLAGNDASVDNLSIEAAGVDEDGAYIKNPRFPWNGDIEFFSNTRFAYSCYYSSTARSSFDRYVYQLMKEEDDLFLTWLHTSSNYEKSMEEGEEGTEFSGYEIQVYQWMGDAWELVTDDVLPNGFRDTQMFEKNVTLDADLSFDRLRLDYGKEKRLFKWNGQSFYR